MRIETERLIIRSIRQGDEIAYAEMARDGSLSEIGFGKDFCEWMGDWIKEALELTEKDDPRADYIPCTILLKSTAEKIGFELSEIKMYKDICEEEEELYRFYTIKQEGFK